MLSARGLRVSGPGAARGVLTLDRGRVLRGRLGGRAVSLRYRSSKVF